MRTTVVLFTPRNFKKTPPTNPRQWAKGTGDYMLYKIDKKRLLATKPNSVKVRSSQIVIMDNMKHFLGLYWKLSPTNIILHVVTNK